MVNRSSRGRRSTTVVMNWSKELWGGRQGLLASSPTLFLGSVALPFVWEAFLRKPNLNRVDMRLVAGFDDAMHNDC